MVKIRRLVVNRVRPDLKEPETASYLELIKSPGLDPAQAPTRFARIVNDLALASIPLGETALMVVWLLFRHRASAGFLR
jgi:hypothetical protein